MLEIDFSGIISCNAFSVVPSIIKAMLKICCSISFFQIIIRWLNGWRNFLRRFLNILLDNEISKSSSGVMRVFLIWIFCSTKKRFLEPFKSTDHYSKKENGKDGFQIVIDYRGRHWKSITLFNDTQVNLHQKPLFSWSKIYDLILLKKALNSYDYSCNKAS